MFSDNFKVTAAPIADGVHAFVIDNALADPDALVQFATKAKSAFRDAAPTNFPGRELRMTDAFSAKFDDFFRIHIRQYFDARRTRSFSTHLSMLTQPSIALHPAQWLPQCDFQGLYTQQTSVVCELNLFRDESLGGTGFYMPRRPLRDIAELVRDANTIDRDDFLAKHKVEPGYCVNTNEYFQLTQVIHAKFNRLVFFDSAMFHAPHITAAEKLSNDPVNARLKLHGNFLCKRHSDGRANRWLV